MWDVHPSTLTLPNELYQPQQHACVAAAIERVQARFTALAPGLAAHFLPWVEQLTPAGVPASYFLSPGAFPLCLLPWWCEQTCHAAPNLPLQQDIAYACVAGYYYIRLLDNLMDGDRPLAPALLPALNLLLAESLRVPQRYFPPEHPFWATFDQVWGRAADVTAQDALLATPDENQFRRVAAQKQQAGNLPIAIVAHYYHRPQLCEPWANFIQQFSVWHQMLDDVFDWYKDDAHGQTTYFLAEAHRRKAPTESVAAWVTHTGFAWGCATLQTWFNQVHTAAHALACPALTAYLAFRHTQFTQHTASVQQALQKLLPILAVGSASSAVALNQ